MKIRFKSLVYSDAALVEGILKKDPEMERNLYLKCKKYFSDHYRAVFFAPDHVRDDIFQNTYLALWDNIERGKISVREGVLLGRKNQPINCSLMTYMMSIAKLKYLELVRQDGKESPFATIEERNARLVYDPEEQKDWLHDDERMGKLEAISDCIAVMSERCRQILTLFYVEDKKLDEVLLLLPTFTSKDALKTAKNKCLAKLKSSSKELYQLRRNI